MKTTDTQIIDRTIGSIAVWSERAGTLQVSSSGTPEPLFLPSDLRKGLVADRSNGHGVLSYSHVPNCTTCACAHLHKY